NVGTPTAPVFVPPVFWHPENAPNDNSAGVRYPYAIIGDGSWGNYTISANVLFTQDGTNAGLIGQFTQRYTKQIVTESDGNDDIGHFNGYVFDVSTTGAWTLYKNTDTDGPRIVLTSGTLAQPLGTGTWHKLSMSFSNKSDGSTVITMAIDGSQSSVTDPSPYP